MTIRSDKSVGEGRIASKQGRLGQYLQLKMQYRVCNDKRT